jgi:hypothetical protein
LSQDAIRRVDRALYTARYKGTTCNRGTPIQTVLNTTTGGSIYCRTTALLKRAERAADLARATTEVQGGLGTCDAFRCEVPIMEPCQSATGTGKSSSIPTGKLNSGMQLATGCVCFCTRHMYGNRSAARGCSFLRWHWVIERERDCTCPPSAKIQCTCRAAPWSWRQC